VIERREAFLAEILGIEPHRLVFIDESGSNIGMSREYGRSLPGKRIIERLPRNRGSVTTMIGALRVDGLHALMTIQGGTSRDVFLEFIREHLVPVLRPGDVVVMDNLGAHHATGVREAIEAGAARVLYLPAYCLRARQDYFVRGDLHHPSRRPRMVRPQRLRASTRMSGAIRLRHRHSALRSHTTP